MNEWLRALYEEDRDDARTFRGAEAFLASQARRGLIAPLVAAGGLVTAEDYYHASFLYQHGERLEHWAQAHLLARTAADRGHPQGRYQAAAAYDRWLMHMGQPQHYGTNSIRDGNRWRVWDTDPATTDAERAAWDVPSWAELLARGERAFGYLDTAAVDREPFVTVELAGLRIDLFHAEPPAEDRPITPLPPYTPLGNADPRPGELPAGVSLWRFDGLGCAKSAEGQILLTWHPCTWQVQDAPPETAAAVYAAQAGEPQWMSPAAHVWQRLGLATGPATCWVVGGQIGREGLARVARSLV